MDVQYFLTKRTQFIRQFYDKACEPFRETIRKIEAQEAPFKPSFDQSDFGPAFEIEWSDANTALETLGRTCVSMLSASMHLYFMTWERDLGISWKEGERKQAFKNGVAGYLRALDQILHLPWEECLLNFGILDEVILTRNRDQHPDRITTLAVRHHKTDSEQYSKLAFISDTDRKIFSDPDMAKISWMNPAVHVSRESLLAALDQVEALGAFLEERMFDVKYPQRKKHSAHTVDA